MKINRIAIACSVALLSLGSARAVILNSLDLTTGGAGTINGGFFVTVDQQSTGTGVISSFVRVQDNGVADGYNATARPVMPDVNTSPTFTHDIQLGEVPIVTLTNANGATPGKYYEFLLDINQTNANPLLSLDKIQIYTRGTALTTAGTLADLTALPSVPRYDLDAGTDSEILLNYSLNSGSGSGDLLAYIPVEAFTGAKNTDYVYLYSMFGSNAPSYTENDGFEEWAIRTGPGVPNSIPDGGASVALLGLAMTGLGTLRRFWKKN